MDEITLDDQTYVSSKRAAQITGYAKDYVGQLCREGRVEARLVGRNWYVLETSIREHRFGSTTASSKHGTSAEAANTAPNKAWESVNYSHDSAAELLPTLTQQENKPEADNFYEKPRNTTFEKPAAVPVSSQVVKEMQSAWQDWFTKTHELEVSKEILLENVDEESHTPPDSVEEIVPLHKVEPEMQANTANTHFDTETTPVTLEKVADAIEKRNHISEPDEEIVPIHRSTAPSTTYTRAPQQYGQEARPTLGPQGRIVRERRIIKKRPSRFLQTILILIAIASIATAAIGSGVFDKYIASYTINNKAINFLVGESSFNK